MKKILFTWLGSADLKSAENNGVAGLGPIRQALTARDYDQTVILSNYPEKVAKDYIRWLKKQKIRGDVSLELIDLGGNPTDYRAIYKSAKSQVRSYAGKLTKNLDITFHLSPGTSQMATVWVILANTVFNASLIQSSPERGVQDVDFPFDIAADYLPELLKKSGRKIASLFEDDEVAGFEDIIHRGAAMKALVRQAKKIAPYPLPVLILGESGTGKELLANAIHIASGRRGGFVALNCGAIPDNLFESELFGHKKGSFTGADRDKDGYIEAAKDGTLFLDEIGEMPLKIQVKLLRVLQEKKFSRIGDTKPCDADIRIISATNRNLIEEVVSGMFREDLFYRLAVGILNIPSLREREGDVSLLIEHFLKTADSSLNKGDDSNPRKLSAGAKNCLLNHLWPGNVRELQNTLLRAVIWSEGEVIDRQDIEASLLLMTKKGGEKGGILNRPLIEGFDLEGVMGEVACHYLTYALEKSGGNKSKAAKLLNFSSYQKLDNWLKKYDLCSEEKMAKQ